MVPRLLLAAGLLFVCLADDTKSSAAEENPSAVENNPSAPLSPASLFAIELSKDALPAEFTCTSIIFCNRPVYYVSSFCYWVLSSIGEIIWYFAEPIVILEVLSRIFGEWRRRNPDEPIEWSGVFFTMYFFVIHFLLAYFIISKMSDMYVNPSDSDLYVPPFLLQRAHTFASRFAARMSTKESRIMFIQTVGNLWYLVYMLVEFLHDKYTQWRERREEQPAIENEEREDEEGAADD